MFNYVTLHVRIVLLEKTCTKIYTQDAWRNPGCIAMLPTPEIAMSDYKLVDKKGLKTIYGVPYSHQHIARLEKAGHFPQRKRLGPCRVAWLCSEIEAWIVSRVYSVENTDTS